MCIYLHILREVRLMKYDINYLVLSDLHLGRQNNHIVNIATNLKTYILKHDRKLKKLDLMFINGDVYDRLLNHGSLRVLLMAHIFASSIKLNVMKKSSLIYSVIYNIFLITKFTDYLYYYSSFIRRLT